MRFLTFIVLLFVASPALASSSMGQLKTTFAPIVKQTAGAVVNIFTEKVIPENRRNSLVNNPSLQNFFDDYFTQPMRSRIEKSLGSGVVVTQYGHIVTNYHVIKDASSIKVVFNDGREFNAQLINADKRTDIAVLSIKLAEDEKVDYLKFGNSKNLEVGDIILAIGNPYGVGQSVSMGIISALGRSNLGMNKFENFIQTDAAINPGNSGGAMVDSNGLLVGINTAIFSKNGSYQGIGFATPVNVVKTIVESILVNGKVSKPWFGANGQNLTVGLAETLGLKKVTGVLINEISNTSPAQKSGLLVGDIILKINNNKVNNTYNLNSTIATISLTEEAELTILRNGKEKKLYVQFEEIPERRAENQITLQGRHPLRGTIVEKITPALIQQLNMPLNTKGVMVIANRKLSGAYGANLKQGDIIISINKVAINNLQTLQKVLAKRSRYWNISYKRGNKLLHAKIKN